MLEILPSPSKGKHLSPTNKIFLTWIGNMAVKMQLAWKHQDPVDDLTMLNKFEEKSATFDDCLFQGGCSLYYSQTKWSVPLKIALRNGLFETWTR